MIYNFLNNNPHAIWKTLWIHQFGDYSINIPGIMMFLAFFFFLFIWYLFNVYYVPCAINIHLWVKQRDYFCESDFVAWSPRNRRLISFFTGLYPSEMNTSFIIWKQFFFCYEVKMVFYFLHMTKSEASVYYNLHVNTTNYSQHLWDSMKLVCLCKCCL